MSDQDPDDTTKQEIIDALKDIDDRQVQTQPKGDPRSAAERMLAVHEHRDKMARKHTGKPDGPPQGTGHIIGGWLLLAFAFVRMVVALTIAYGNTRTWEGTAIPGDLTPTETLGELTYQIWAGVGCLVGALIAAVLIIVGVIRRRG